MSYPTRRSFSSTARIGRRRMFTVTAQQEALSRGPVELKRRIGVLPEDLGLFDDLTVEEHLSLIGSVYGLDKQVTRARTNQLLRALNLEHGRGTFAAACSHGMPLGLRKANRRLRPPMELCFKGIMRTRSRLSPRHRMGVARGHSAGHWQRLA
jgi:hypothetical protein